MNVSDHSGLHHRQFLWVLLLRWTTPAGHTSDGLDERGSATTALPEFARQRREYAARLRQHAAASIASAPWENCRLTVSEAFVTGYVALSRVRTADDILILQPFSKDVFQKGVADNAMYPCSGRTCNHKHQPQSAFNAVCWSRKHKIRNITCRDCMAEGTRKSKRGEKR